MPRWASRLTLEIEHVKIEELHHISIEDIRAEGIQKGLTDEMKMNFAAMWNEIFKKKGFGWDKNPWVWAITFKVLL